jgi:hypothetical protein
MPIASNRPLFLLALALSCSSGLACDGQTETSAEIGRFTFVYDEVDERLALRIELAGIEPAECMRTTKPIEGSVEWTENALERAVHDNLISLISDVDRFDAYRQDTDFAARNELEECSAWPAPDAPCYVEELVVAGVASPWRFSLKRDVALSDEGQGLVEGFLAAHEACTGTRSPSETSTLSNTSTP